MNWIDLLTMIGSVATALGVFVAALQIHQTKRQAVTSFEDSLSSQYRELAQRMPVEALLGEDLEERAYRENLNEFYHYIDLTNEQIFLRMRDRISLATWENWCDGIRTILAKPAFARAWEEISRRSPGSFEELRRLISYGYAEDPIDWR